MLVRKIIGLCAALVLSGVSSVAISQNFTFSDALQNVQDDGSLIVPDGYTSIGQNAFKDILVTSVTLPNSITRIEDYAFDGSGLTEIILSDSLNYIGNYAFRNTENLTQINFPNTLTYISNNAFERSGLTDVVIPESISTIGSSSFAYSNITNLTLPNNITISAKAFYESKVKNLIIPNGATLEQEAFNNTALESLVIGENVNGNGNSIFGYQDNLKTIVSRSKFGCSDIRGLCVLSGANLEYVIALAGPITNSHTYKISQGSAVLYINGHINEYYNFYEASAKEILLGPNITITEPIINGVYHSVCSDEDSDLDGHLDCYDQFPNDPSKWFDYSDSEDVEETNPISSGLVHSDGDGLADIFDLSPTDGAQADSNSNSNTEHAVDTDGDGYRNDRDIDDDDDGLLDIYEPFFGTNPLIPDSDFDGTLDGLDAFPLDNTESLDTDSDGIGNNADTDDDNDGHFDLLDAFPLDANEWMDSDLDGVGNNADTDDDNDGVLDEEDAFPYTASESVDTDGDGVGDNSDAFPNDSSETLDTDLDGIGNNADDDDDNDAVVDAEDSDPLNDAIGALESQNLFVMGNPVAVNGYLATISVGYDVSDDNNQLTGIGFRVHYDSSIYSYSAVESTINASLIVDAIGPYQDIEDFDNDSTTDSYIVFGWAAVNADWPNIELPAKLTDIQLFVNWNDYDAGSTTSNINFSIVDNAEGYEAKSTDYAMTVLPATWDFDGNGSADALTDGLMLLRYTFGIRDLRMASGAMAQNSTLSATQVVDNMHRAISVADIDGNGSTDALTDGLILLRYLFGLRGEILITGAISSDATRTTQEQIEQYLSLYMPEALVSPVQSEQNFLVGDWKLAKLAEHREYEYDGVLSDWGPIPDWRGYNQSVFDTCVADDIYRFGINGTFEYLLNGSTFMDVELNPLTHEEEASGCTSPPPPWNESDVYTFSTDENNKLLTVIGIGAYIGLSNVANNTDDIENAADAPESITYNYTKISDNQIILEIDAWNAPYRYTLVRVPSN